MKKFLALLLSLTMCAGLLAACDKKDNAETETEDAGIIEQVHEHREENQTEKYLEFMSEYIADTYAVIDSIEALVAVKDEIETKDDYVEWLRLLLPIKNEVNRLSNNLATIAHDVPDEYVEPHTMIVEANTAALEAMTEFEDVIIDIHGMDISLLLVAVEGDDGESVLVLLGENEGLLADAISILASKIEMAMARAEFEETVAIYYS